LPTTCNKEWNSEMIQNERSRMNSNKSVSTKDWNCWWAACVLIIYVHRYECAHAYFLKDFNFCNNLLPICFFTNIWLKTCTNWMNIDWQKHTFSFLYNSFIIRIFFRNIVVNIIDWVQNIFKFSCKKFPRASDRYISNSSFILQISTISATQVLQEFQSIIKPNTQKG